MVKESSKSIKNKCSHWAFRPILIGKHAYRKGNIKHVRSWSKAISAVFLHRNWQRSQRIREDVKIPTYKPHTNHKRSSVRSHTLAPTIICDLSHSLCWSQLTDLGHINSVIYVCHPLWSVCGHRKGILTSPLSVSTDRQTLSIHRYLQSQAFRRSVGTPLYSDTSMRNYIFLQ